MKKPSLKYAKLNKSIENYNSTSVASCKNITSNQFTTVGFPMHSLLTADKAIYTLFIIIIKPFHCWTLAIYSLCLIINQFRDNLQDGYISVLRGNQKVLYQISSALLLKLQKGHIDDAAKWLRQAKSLTLSILHCQF